MILPNQVIAVLEAAMQAESITEHSFLNFVLTDGYNLARSSTHINWDNDGGRLIFFQIATRYIHDPTGVRPVPPASLYFASGTGFECANGCYGDGIFMHLMHNRAHWRVPHEAPASTRHAGHHHIRAAHRRRHRLVCSRSFSAPCGVFLRFLEFP